MATIILEEKEAFSHLHLEKSESRCTQGKVEVRIGDSKRTLNAGDSIVIEPGMNHVITNMGKGPAYIECAHMPEPPPPGKQ